MRSIVFRSRILTFAWVAPFLACVCVMGAVAVGDNRFEPITLAASSTGSFAHGYPWYASLNSAGQGQLIVERPDGCVTKPFCVPRANVDAYRDMVFEERLPFDLKENYGNKVPNGNTQTLTVMREGGATTVRLHDLGGPEQWKAMDPKSRSELARAVHAWMVMRAWIDDPEAGDSRQSKSFQKILDLEPGVLKPYKPKDTAADASACQLMPITLSASYKDDGKRRDWWVLSVNAAGEGQLTSRMERLSKKGLLTQEIVAKPFHLSPAQLTELRKTLTEQRFFDLKKREFGGWIHDGGHTRRLTIVEGPRAKTIQTGLLSRDERGAPGSETYRALRVWNLIRGWVKDKIPVTQYETIW